MSRADGVMAARGFHHRLLEEPVDASDEDVFDAAVLQLGDDLEPEPRALGLLEPHAQDLLAPLEPDADRQVDGGRCRGRASLGAVGAASVLSSGPWRCVRILRQQLRVATSSAQTQCGCIIDCANPAVGAWDIAAVDVLSGEAVGTEVLVRDTAASTSASRSTTSVGDSETDQETEADGQAAGRRRRSSGVHPRQATTRVQDGHGRWVPRRSQAYVRSLLASGDVDVEDRPRSARSARDVERR